jgi:hypothetical protein
MLARGHKHQRGLASSSMSCDGCICWTLHGLCVQAAASRGKGRGVRRSRRVSTGTGGGPWAKQHREVTIREGDVHLWDSARRLGCLKPAWVAGGKAEGESSMCFMPQAAAVSSAAATVSYTPASALHSCGCPGRACGPPGAPVARLAGS